MLPITLKLKHNYNNNKNHNLEIVSFPVSPAVIEYVKVYDKNKLTVIHVSNINKDESIEKSIYISKNTTTEVFTADKIFTRSFETDDYYLVHKVCKDLSTIAITAVTKPRSQIRYIKNNRISLVRLENNIWTYFNDVVLPPQVKYKNRYRLSQIMSFDHKGDHLGVLLSAKDKHIRTTRRGCGVIYEVDNRKYVYRGYFKYKTTSSEYDSTLLDIRYNIDSKSLDIILIGDKEQNCKLITEEKEKNYE